MTQTTPVTCPGFRFSGVAAGLKKRGGPDLGLIACDPAATVAGIFTTNQVKAAPVLLDTERLALGHTFRAILVNSGCANCCTGGQGMADAVAMSRHAATALDCDEHQVLVASTGVIGRPLDTEKIGAATGDLVASLSEDGLMDFATAIMTTDTAPKISSRTVEVDGRAFTVCGVAKGAGMIRPNMATMLAFVMTDARAGAETLQNVLRSAADASFNRVTVDGDTSTNDTLLLAASGVSAVEAESCLDVFSQAVHAVCLDLAKALVADGEGATRSFWVTVKNARTRPAAKAVADAIAHSPLVKTAVFGRDANWGRILASAGRAGVPLDPDRMDVYFNDVCVVKGGMGCGEQAEADAAAVMEEPEFSLTVDLNQGTESASLFTCDFTLDYIKINADYRT